VDPPKRPAANAPAPRPSFGDKGAERPRPPPAPRLSEMRRTPPAASIPQRAPETRKPRPLPGKPANVQEEARGRRPGK
jgi:hypothetical protein